MKPAKKITNKSKPQSPIRVGESVFICTVTRYYVGRIVALSREEIVLLDAAWITDTGRFAQALATGALSEVEPYPSGVPVSVARGAVVDVSAWRHPLPRDVK